MQKFNVKKSYGVLCCRYNEKKNKIEYLFIKRKISFAYADFIYYHKDLSNKSLYLFNNMTQEEKRDLLSLDFDRVWYRIWSKEKGDLYEKYKEYYNKKISDGGKYLKTLITQSYNIEPWEIPKGRKNPYEGDILCAIREFTEETGISSNSLYMLDEKPEIITTISGNTKYICYYYLALYTGINMKHKINYFNDNQATEVSEVDWLSDDKIGLLKLNKFLEIVKKAEKLLRSKYKIQKIYELNLLNFL